MNKSNDSGNLAKDSVDPFAGLGSRFRDHKFPSVVGQDLPNDRELGAGQSTYENIAFDVNLATCSANVAAGIGTGSPSRLQVDGEAFGAIQLGKEAFVICGLACSHRGHGQLSLASDE